MTSNYLCTAVVSSSALVTRVVYNVIGFEGHRSYARYPDT